MQFKLFEGFFFGKSWKNMEKLGGYGWIGEIRHGQLQPDCGL